MPGELRQRSERLYAFASVEELEAVLERLGGRRLIVRYERRPGQKEARWGLGEAFGGGGEGVPAPEPPPPAYVPGEPPSPRAPADGADALAGRVDTLEAQVGELRAVVERLRGLLD